MKTRTRLIAIASTAVALVFAGALPAFADHNAGVSDDGGCVYGGLLLGGPPRGLAGGDWTALRVRGSLTIVCSFRVPLTEPACESPAGCDDTKGPFTAPNRPKAYPVTRCFAPGTELAGETEPNGKTARPADRGSIVFYRTRALLTCFWKDDPTNDPGYNDPYDPNNAP